MRGRDYALLVLVCLALFLPGIARIPPLDRDEPRFAQASRQMLQSGDYVNIRFQDEARLKKPAGIYWLQAASAALFASEDNNSAIWPYRLPSTIGATLAVLLTAAIGARLFGAAVGWVAALAMATSLLLGIEARLAKTDAVLLATVCAAQLGLARAYFGRSGTGRSAHTTAILFWAALGFGLLLKGPIIVMVSGLTALGLVLWDRQAGWLRGLKTWPYALLTVLIVAPWGVAIMLQSKGAFLSEAVGHDLMAKVAGAQEAHGAPPGYFLVTIWGTFWPFSLLAGLAVPWVWRHRAHPSVRFCLAWLVPSWLVFELVPTKLPHYVLPLFPALALLAARAGLDAAALSARGLLRILGIALIVVWLAITILFGVGPSVLLAFLTHHVDAAAAVASVASAALLIAAPALFLRQRRALALASLLTGSIAFSVTNFDRVMPQLDPLWVTARVAQAVHAARPCRNTNVTAAGISEPSLVFLLGKNTRFGDGATAADALLKDSCALAVVDRPYLDGFTTRLKQAGKAATALATIDGFNLARGARVDLTLFGGLHAGAGS